MKDAVLLELAARWERNATPPQCEDGSPAAAIGNAEAHGRRQGLRECADGLRMLVQLLGGPGNDGPKLAHCKSGDNRLNPASNKRDA